MEREPFWIPMFFLILTFFDFLFFFFCLFVCLFVCNSLQSPVKGVSSSTYATGVPISLGRHDPLTRYVIEVKLYNYVFCTPRNFFLIGATGDQTRKRQGTQQHSKSIVGNLPNCDTRKEVYWCHKTQTTWTVSFVISLVLTTHSLDKWRDIL
jgi:hypothetical protein